jgi:hypothetical protein
MEQLRHRLTNVSPKGQRRSVDQNPLKRSDLDDFASYYNPPLYRGRIETSQPPLRAGTNYNWFVLA